MPTPDPLHRLPPAEALVLCAVRVSLETAPPEALRRRLDGAVVWTDVEEAAAREGVSGLVARALAEGSAGASPASGAMRRAATLGAAHAMRLRHEAEVLGAALRAAGVAPVVVKGFAVAERWYGGRLDLRPFGDVDLLVREQERGIVERLLAEQGFAPDLVDERCWHRETVALDLHTIDDLVEATTLPLRTRAYRLREEDLWRRARPLVPGSPLLALSDEDQLLHGALHGLKHSFERLIWLVDLAQMAAGVDPLSLRVLARRAGLARAVTYALELNRTLLGVAPPRGLETTSAWLHPAERLYLARVSERQPMPRVGDWMAWFAMPTAGDRLAYAWQSAFPPWAQLAHVARRTGEPDEPWRVYPARAARIAGLGLAEARRTWRWWTDRRDPDQS